MKKPQRQRGGDWMEAEIFRIDNRAFLRLGESTAEIKDYKISSSMHGGTELEVIIPINGDVTEFLMSARKESPPQRSQ